LDLFFSQRIPHLDRVVLVESGSRQLFNGFVGDLYKIHGEHIRIDLVTCFSGLPDGFRPENGKVYRVRDYPGFNGAKRLAKELRQRGPTVLGIISSAEPILMRWKWWLMLTLRSKVFVLNENGDYFWVDYSKWKTILHFVAFRLGLSGANGVLLLGRMLLFPFVLAVLAAYAAWMHGRRWLRLQFNPNWEA
jgi:hypothetical protein